MEPLLWLTPAENRRPPLRRWMLVPPAVGAVACLAGELGGLESLLSFGGLLAAAGAVPLAWWFEERIYGSLVASSTTAKIAANVMLAGMTLPLLVLSVIIGTIPLVGAFTGAFAATFVWWAGASCVGTCVVVVIDRSVSAWQARFPVRLTFAILFLMGAALLLAMAASMLSSLMVSALSSGSEKVTVTSGVFGMSSEEFKVWLRDHPHWVSVGVFMFTFLAAFPAVLSACAKLADAAMERLRPMSRAFSMVSQGKRTVRVEEQGSTEFIELAQTFNQLVVALDATERMEKAFGRYVSGQVLSRIKAQHGEAELKPSLRVATVFFADIRGFTSFSEKLSAEQVVEFLNRYLARVVAQVDAHEGYLNKFIGDAVVVVFNGPLDQTDHAERAVRCALALQAEVAKINAEGVLPEVGELRIGAGIATGPMVCGNVGGPTQMEYTVIGDTVNLSARLTSLAGPGEVWVSEATARAAPAFKYTVLPEVKLKGKEKPVAPLRAEGVAP